MRAEERSFKSAVKSIILDRLGALHEEPVHLFVDDMRESFQPYSILSVIGNGSNRVSEIAGRLNKPVTHLSRPIDNLIRLGYVRREIPSGELEKNSKRGIYRISDPYLNFYFTFVVPNLSRLEPGLTDIVYNEIEKRLPGYVSLEWENLCRRAVPMKPFDGLDFNIASRWWGQIMNKENVELDLIAGSVDKKTLLAGECKWSRVNEFESLLRQVEKKVASLPFAQGKRVFPVLFIRETSAKQIPQNVLLPSDISDRLRK